MDCCSFSCHRGIWHLPWDYNMSWWLQWSLRMKKGCILTLLGRTSTVVLWNLSVLVSIFPLWNRYLEFRRNDCSQQRDSLLQFLRTLDYTYQIMSFHPYNLQHFIIVQSNIEYMRSIWGFFREKQSHWSFTPKCHWRFGPHIVKANGKTESGWIIWSRHYMSHLFCVSKL